ICDIYLRDDVGGRLVLSVQPDCSCRTKAEPQKGCDQGVDMSFHCRSPWIDTDTIIFCIKLLMLPGHCSEHGDARLVTPRDSATAPSLHVHASSVSQAP